MKRLVSGRVMTSDELEVDENTRGNEMDNDDDDDDDDDDG
jgi:hypothetical protein